MEESQDIIEVEATYKEKPSQKEKKPPKPKKAKYQFGRRIALFTKIDYFTLRAFFPSFIFGGLGVLFFGIAFSENQTNAAWLVLLIVSAAVTGLALVAFCLHFLWRLLIHRWMEKDPNFQ